MKSSPAPLPPQTLNDLLSSVPSAFLMLDAHGLVTYVNSVAARLMSRSPESLLGCDLRHEFSTLLTESWDQACETARSEQRTVKYEVHNVALAGWFRLFLTPINGGLVVHLKDTTELNRMMQLQQLSTALATCSTPEEVSRVTLNQAVTMMGAYLGSIFELNLNGNELNLTGDTGYPDALKEASQSVPLAENFPACEAVRTRQPVFLVGEALAKRYARRPEVRSAATRSLASLPLLVEGRALGVLVLSFQTEQTFRVPAQEFMLAFALQCAQAIERVRGQQVLDDSRERLAFLAATSELLSSSLDIPGTLQRLGQLAVGHLADWVSIFLPDEHGQLQLVSTVHRDPERLALVHELMAYFPVDMESQGGVAQVYRSGLPTLIPVVPAAALETVQDERQRELLRALNLESLISVPLITRGRVLGVMGFTSASAHRRYAQADLELAEELARRAASTIENAQLFQATQDGEERLAGIISTVTDAVITSTEDGLIVLFNAAAEQMFGISASDALGQLVERIRPNGSAGLNFLIEETTSEVVVRGQRLLTSVLRDVTQRVEAEQTLLESESRFRATFDQAAVGIAHVDLDGHWLEVNQRLCDIAGYSREDLLKLSFAEITHPDDIEEDLEQADQLKAGKIHTYSMQKRYLHQNGSVVWVNLTVSMRRGEDGAAQYFISVVEDISEIKQAEEALRSARDDLERRVEERTADLQRLSQELRVQVQELEERNTQAKVLSELSEMLQSCFSFHEVEQVVAQHVAQLFPGTPGQLYTYGASKNSLEELVAWNGASSSTFLFGPEECWGLRRGRLFASASGELSCQHHHATGATLCVPMLAQGETVGLLYFEGNASSFSKRQERLAQTVAESVALAMVNLRLRETLRQQSIRDPLTGLFNRRYLEETFERELRRAERKGECIGIIMLDVDRFKMFNDTHGHEAGDALLRTLGSLLKDSVRAEDVACRYGGEEFTLLLSGATQQQTFERAEQVREAITRLKVMNQGELLEGVSASMGVATFPQHGRELAGLVRAADLALYRAKREGRNRVMNAD
ncbi:diguanylate cyclase (plasmid) [Deinococcus radiomollis]|uniref:diguanylate cyclase n=1 Tax=Deinococcus radiomollis TaxID=468916 RepID=UPI0038925F99